LESLVKQTSGIVTDETRELGVPTRGAEPSRHSGPFLAAKMFAVRRLPRTCLDSGVSRGMLIRHPTPVWCLDLCRPFVLHADITKRRTDTLSDFLFSSWPPIFPVPDAPSASLRRYNRCICPFLCLNYFFASTTKRCAIYRCTAEGHRLGDAFSSTGCHALVSRVRKRTPPPTALNANDREGAPK